MMDKRNKFLAASTGLGPLLYAGLTIFCVYAWWMRIENIDLQIAWNGFSPIAWVYQSFNPNNFVLNFPGGIEIYDKSAFMYVYRGAYNHFGITPETLIPMIIGFEFAMIAAAVYALSRTLMPAASRVIPALVIMLVVTSWARDTNLARFGEPYFAGLHYNIADGLRVLGIVAVLRGWLLLGAVLIAAAVTTHPMMGLYAGVFVLAVLAFRPRDLLRMRAVTAVVVFLVITVGWLIAVMEPSVVTGGGIPRNEWFKLTQLMSFHWYPVEFGVFTTGHGRHFLPFLSFGLLFVFYITHFTPFREIDLKVIAGCIAMLLLVLTGIVVSVLMPSPALVKLALHRANDLIILVGLVYVTNGLWSELESAHVWRHIVAVLVLVSPFLVKPGYPLFPSILLVAPAFLSVFRRKITARNLFVSGFTFGAMLLALAYLAAGTAGPWISSAYTGHAFILRLISAYGARITLPLLALVFLIGKWADRHLVHTVVVVIFAASAVLWVMDQRMRPEEIMRNQDYKQAQLWAKKSTPKTALFMTDPTIYYGWRDYSQRSSFGNLREWLYTGWGYTSNGQVYEEGLNRFNEFGIELDKYFSAHDAFDHLKGFGRLSLKVQEAYYRAGDEWRLHLARRYKIGYFVLQKDRITKPSRLPVVYENERFMILSAS